MLARNCSFIGQGDGPWSGLPFEGRGGLLVVNSVGAAHRVGGGPRVGLAGRSSVCVIVLTPHREPAVSVCASVTGLPLVPAAQDTRER